MKKKFNTKQKHIQFGVSTHFVKVLTPPHSYYYNYNG